MVEAALRSGRARSPATFEVFARRLADGRPWGVFAGLERTVEAIENFHFGQPELAWLEENSVVDRKTLEWLSAYRFSGNVDGYREGELYTTGSPVLTVEGTFAEAVLLETVVLGILNFDSAVAGAAELDHMRCRPPTCHRNGQPARGPSSSAGRSPGGLPGRVRQHLQPRGREALRDTDSRHGLARLRAGLPQSERSICRPGRDLRSAHHFACRHLRHS